MREKESRLTEAIDQVCAYCRLDHETYQLLLCPLHAAAPELLQAATAAVRYLLHHDIEGDWRETTLQDLKAAIAKAKGGTP